MKNLIIGVILGAIIATVNGWDFEDEVKQQELYCNMNSGGLWYDNPERFHRICPIEPGAGKGQEATRIESYTYTPPSDRFTF